MTPDLDALARKYGGSIDDLAAKYGATVTERGTTPLNTDQTTRLGTAPVVPPADPNFLADAAASIPSNLGAAARGVVGGLAAPVTVIADPLTHLINLLLPEKYKQLPPSAGLQTLLTDAGVPNAQTEAQKIMEAAVGGLAGGAGNVLVGSALKAVPGVVGRVGEALVAQPSAQLTGGATGGAASESAAALGAPPAIQAAAGLAGGAIGGGLGNTEAVASPVGPVREAVAVGVPLMTSDVRPPTTGLGKWVQTVSEIIGTGTVRQKQQLKREAALQDFVHTYGADDLNAASGTVMQDLLDKRSADLNRWTTAKDEVLQKLSNPPVDGETFGRTPQERINDLATLEANRVITPAQQVELNQLRANPSKRVVPMTSTNVKIDEAVAYLTSLKTDAVKPAIKALTDWKQALQGQDLANVETLRKQIGEVFVALRPDTNVPTASETVLASIYGKKDANGIPVDGLLKDMTDYIKANGGQADLDKWLVANKNLASMMHELDLRVLKTTLDKGEVTPEQVQNMLFSKDQSTVAALYRNLTPKGQAAARAAVIAKAAVDKTGAEVSPDKFVDNVKKLSTQVGVTFSGDDLKALDGLVRVFEYTKRAGVQQAAPPTGLKGALMLPVSAAALTSIFGGGLKGFTGAVGAGLAVGGAARVYESKAVRDLLTKLPTLKAGSDAEQAVLKAIVVRAQTLNATPEGGTSAPSTTLETARPDQSPMPRVVQGSALRPAPLGVISTDGAFLEFKTLEDAQNYILKHPGAQLQVPASSSGVKYAGSEMRSR